MSPAPWLREEDLELGEEDLERNREQAGRNAAMRARLRIRRESKMAVEAPEEMAVEAPDEIIPLPSSAERAEAEVGEMRPPWFVHRPKIASAVLRLHEEIFDFMDFMKHTE